MKAKLNATKYDYIDGSSSSFFVATVLAWPLLVPTWHCLCIKPAWRTYLVWPEPWPEVHSTPLCRSGILSVNQTVSPNVCVGHYNALVAEHGCSQGHKIWWTDWNQNSGSCFLCFQCRILLSFYQSFLTLSVILDSNRLIMYSLYLICIQLKCHTNAIHCSTELN